MKLLVLTLSTLSQIGCFYTDDVSCHDLPENGTETRGHLVSVASGSREIAPMNEAFSLEAEQVHVGLGAVVLGFRRPREIGSTTLAALGGQLCEFGSGGARTCVGVDGTVDVVATCEGLSCPWVDIRLDVPEPTTPPSHAFVHGSARLLHREWTEQACTHTRHGSSSDLAVEL